MEYTNLGINGQREHLQRRINMVEETHYSNVVTLKLLEQDKKTNVPEYEQTLEIIKSTDRVHKHLTKMLKDLPSEEETEPDATS